VLIFFYHGFRSTIKPYVVASADVFACFLTAKQPTEHKHTSPVQALVDSWNKRVSVFGVEYISESNFISMDHGSIDFEKKDVICIIGSQMYIFGMAYSFPCFDALSSFLKNLYISPTSKQKWIPHGAVYQVYLFIIDLTTFISTCCMKNPLPRM